jgi:hypothetical protein
MVREMIPWYLTAVDTIEAFLFGLTINARSDTVKNAFRMLIIICAVFVMCVA